jgi:hypothetical protein
MEVADFQFAWSCPLSARPFVVRATIHPDRRSQMQYAMLIHAKPGYTDALSEDEQKAMFADYVALGEDPRTRGGAQLQPIETATTVRVQEGQTLTTDGPYADTKEVLVGYYVFEADDLDEAIELAARIPAARLGGAIEVRPLVER